MNMSGGGGGAGGQPSDHGQQKLESLLFKATNPSNKIEDVNTIKLFCDQIEMIHDGAIIAGRLLSHKIQSPQEREALQALAVVEAATKSSQAFVVEVGKFRFLNEMIKMVSPKYHGARTPDIIKQKVIELIYSWTKEFPQEKKINEAYTMLKSQGIVTRDPVHVREAVFAASLKPRSADLSEEESQRLQQLLKSGTPDNLIAANKIIQGMVKKEEVKLEKATRQAMQLQEVTSSMKLLSDMLEQENSETGQGEREIMADLFQACESWRPKLFRLAAEAEEDDPAIGDILYTSDELSRVLNKYKDIIILNKTTGSRTQTTGTTSLNQQLCDISQQQHAAVTAGPVTCSNDPLQQFMLGRDLIQNAEFVPRQNQSVQNTGAAASGLQIQNGGNDSASDNSSMLGLDELLTARTEENQMPSNFSLTKDKGIKELPLMDEEKNEIGDLLSDFKQKPSSTLDLLSDDQSSAANSAAAGSSGQDLANLLLANLSTATGTDVNIMSEQQQQPKNAGLAALDALGERALIDHLPENKEANFVARKLDKLPMRELIRQRSSAQDNVSGQLKNESSEDITNQPQSTSARLTKPEETTSQEQTEQSGSQQQTAAEPPAAAEAGTAQTAVAADNTTTTTKLSDISLGLEDVSPHPSLAPVVLVSEGEVTARLHATTTVPRPGVRVFVLQLTNKSKLQVEEVDCKASVPKGCKVRLLKASSTVLPPPVPFSPPPTATQLMLVLSPPETDLELNLVLSYSLDEEPYTIIGKATLPPFTPE